MAKVLLGSWGQIVRNTEVHPGPNLENRPEDSVLMPLAGEGFLQNAG